MGEIQHTISYVTDLSVGMDIIQSYGNLCNRCITAERRRQFGRTDNRDVFHLFWCVKYGR